jgi:hypothetical protein
MKENPEPPALKLFVVGELSPTPADWDGYNSRALVLAGDAQQAERLTDVPGIAIEIDMTNPAVLAEVFT